MNFEMLHPADQIVTIMDRIYRYGMTTTSGGNLSIMDENGVMWISPSGVDKGRLRREDIMQVFPDGHIEGTHRPSVEYPFHRSVYQKRPDFRAVLHAHPPSLVAYSVARKIPQTKLITNAHLLCGEIVMAPYACPGSDQLGQHISAAFERGGRVVMLENHGVVIGADHLFEAFMIFETLDFCARLQIKAGAIGTPRSLPDRHLEIYKQRNHPELAAYKHESYSSEELAVRRDMCSLISRAYDNMLFTSSQGTFSCRLSDGSFVITPYAKDRKYLEPADLVRIKDGCKEAGSFPSRSVFLHETIYKQHPGIHSVIIAHPPNIMAFAVTDAVFDARLIPESYIMLRTVKKFPFGASFLQAEKMAPELSPVHPVCIVENDCVIVTGDSLLNAFDRLEVMEYSAKSVVYTHTIGHIVRISDDEVSEIEQAFHLV